MRILFTFIFCVFCGLQTFSQASERASTRYYNNGNIAETGYVMGAVKQGLWTIYYETGEKKEESYFRNGLKHGEHREYYLNGYLKSLGS